MRLWLIIKLVRTNVQRTNVQRPSQNFSRREFGAMGGGRMASNTYFLDSIGDIDFNEQSVSFLGGVQEKLSLGFFC